MKKIISVLISISFIMSLFTALPTNATNEVSEKQISTATLDDDFADDCVI